MNIFFNIVAILLIISGIYYIYSAIRNRFSEIKYKIGKLEIPYWLPKIGASIFIIGLGLYVLIV